MISAEPKTSCDSCGTCCHQGGPALHDQDLELISPKLLRFEDLITIRRGEMILMPLSAQPQPAAQELIKIKGKKGNWGCKFRDDRSASCSIYQNRPLACRLLKCWNPEEVLKISGKNLLDRFDLIPENDPLAILAGQFEQQFPLPDMLKIKNRPQNPEKQRDLLKTLKEMISNELRFRELTSRQFKLTASQEVFYFGRPLFQLIIPLGIKMEQSPAGFSLKDNNALINHQLNDSFKTASSK